MFADTVMQDQKQHWDATYRHQEDFFGENPSAFAREALLSFWENGVKSVLELGAGQGRDTVFLADNGLHLTGLDYAPESVAALQVKAEKRHLTARIRAALHDVRSPLPFPEASFDACYSHMLLCMQLNRKEISLVLREIHRVLRPGGLVAYSVRSTFDRQYEVGRYLGEQLYELGGFVVHYFSEEMIRRLAQGFEILSLGRLEEGSLPRDLFTVMLKKTAPLETEVDALRDMPVAGKREASAVTGTEPPGHS